MSTLDTLPKPTTTNITNSDIPVKRGRGKPRDPNAKQVQQIALRPRDWEYISLWAVESYNDADNLSKQVERLLTRLRSHVPDGPAKPFYTPPPDKTPGTRTTPAVAREAASRGITKAELINEMYQLYKAQKARE